MGQINTTVGDLAGNAARILSRAREAAHAGCELYLTPELALSGYPPQDLLFMRDFIDDELRQLDRLVAALPLPTVLGYVERGADGRLYNSAAIVEAGVIKSVVRKTLLPTYDVFDEWRYFKPAEKNEPVVLAGRRIGVTICEDIWDAGYDRRVTPQLAAAGAELLINISSSPFHAGKRRARIDLLARHARATGLPIAYCNLSGAQDELIFDGESMAVNAQGELICIGAQFAEALVIAELPLDGARGSVQHAVAVEPLAEVFRALCLGTRDYCNKCGFTRAVVGMSGGIDSSLVACIGAEALGAENVIGVAMPSRITSVMSNDDALTLAEGLGIEFRVMPIEKSVEEAMRRFRATFGNYHHDVTQENLQARERGKILMEISNDFNALVLSTGNKTEYALGYTTLYGDMCGGLAVIGDVSKPDVYALAHWYNALSGPDGVIPQRSFTRPPSAELREGQVDPFDYARISPLVELIIEEHSPQADLLSRGYTPEELELVDRLVRVSEYKRQQAPPILRVSERAFGIGRRMPIVNRYRA